MPHIRDASRQRAALNQLVASCNDDGRVYRTASFEVTNPEHRKLFLAMSARRTESARILSDLVVGLEGSAPRGGSTLGALRYAVRSIRKLFAGHHDGDIFGECIRMEARMCHLYVQTLRGTWPEGIRSAVNTQHEQAEADHAQMRTLRGQL